MPPLYFPGSLLKEAHFNQVQNLMILCKSEALNQRNPHGLTGLAEPVKKQVK